MQDIGMYSRYDGGQRWQQRSEFDRFVFVLSVLQCEHVYLFCVCSPSWSERKYGYSSERDARDTMGMGLGMGQQQRAWGGERERDRESYMQSSTPPSSPVLQPVSAVSSVFIVRCFVSLFLFVV